MNRIINAYLIKDYVDKLEAAIKLLQEGNEIVTKLSNHAQELHLKVADKEIKIEEKDTQRIAATAALATKKQELRQWASTHAFTLLDLYDNHAPFPLYAICCKRNSVNK